MKKTVHKVFWMWEFDKEEKWLNDMSAQGLQLVKVGFCTYTFEEGLPSEYTYRLELLDNLPTHAKSVDYIKFLEDTDAQYLGSLIRWVYFKKKTSAGEFDLFSDIDSRLAHLDRILVFMGILALLELCLGAINLLHLYYSGHLTATNAWGGGLCLLLGLAIGGRCYSILNNRKALKKERTLHE